MENGRWITINGNHVFVKDGQNPMDAFIRQKGKNNEPEGFENSKIRDENGNLMKMYHGTTQKFEEFDEKKIRKRPDGIKGFFFAPEKRKDHIAGYYSQGTGNIKEVYLNIKNPLYLKSDENEDKIIKDLMESGNIKKYDGIVRTADKDFPDFDYYNYEKNKLETEKVKKGDILEVIAFKKDQIKILK